MNALLIIPLLISFFVTFLVMPVWIRNAIRIGLIGKDVNKFKKPEIVEIGGVVVIAGFTLSVLFYIAIETFYFK